MAADKPVMSLDEILKPHMENPATLEGLAQAAEAAERYDDMVKIMRKLVEKKLDKKDQLTSDQRNLLSVAYKNVVGAKRSSWRMLNDDVQFSDIDKEIVTKYRKVVEKELETICGEVLKMLNDLAEQNEVRMKEKESAESTDLSECQVFYLKMVGDYYRYLTEAFNTNDKYKNQCNEFYGKAMELAKNNLEATHPTRLGLALNYSVCYYEILEKPKQACELAKNAFDEAIEKLDSLNDISYKDSTLIMQLLRDNLTIWHQAEEDTGGDKGGDKPEAEA